MSSPRSANCLNSAWLTDEQTKQYLSIRAWAPEPVPNRLNFFAPDFALNATAPWLVGDPADAPSIEARPLPNLTHRVDPSETDFARLHEDILKRIASGEFEKVVPIVREDWRFAADLGPEMFAPAFDVRPYQLNYGFAFEGEGLCGVTPELLFEVQDGRLTTMALAGTGRADGPDLRADAKEMREHGLVIEHIRGVAKRWGQVEVGDTVERSYGRLKHLYTPIRVTLARAPEFMDLIVHLHPTAALGGYPRQPAVDWLMRQPFHVGRGRFGAPFGHWDGARGRCVVAIRGVGWHGPRMTVAAGCGVVAGSDALREWRELELKRAATYSNLGITI